MKITVWLPPELWLAVLQHLQPTAKKTDNYNDLLGICLVSRHFRQLGQTVLFSSVQIAKVRQAFILLLVLWEQPGLRRLIRELKLHYNCYKHVEKSEKLWQTLEQTIRARRDRLDEEAVWGIETVMRAMPVHMPEMHRVLRTLCVAPRQKLNFYQSLLLYTTRYGERVAAWLQRLNAALSMILCPARGLRTMSFTYTGEREGLGDMGADVRSLLRVMKIVYRESRRIW